MTGDNATVYYDGDATLDRIADRTVAVVGYGNQGRAQALNLRDSGLDVIVGNRADDSRERARADGFDAYPIRGAVDRAGVVLLLVPDEVMPDVVAEHVAPGLDDGDVLSFASGYNVTYGFVEPPAGVDTVLVAPRMIGRSVRETYVEGEGTPAVVGVANDATGTALEAALAVAKGIGATRAGAIEGSFEMETTVDLLSEQAMAPVVFAAMRTKYALEREAGIPPEIILTELYLSGEKAHVYEQMAKKGLVEQLGLHSRTSQYGQLSGGDDAPEDAIESFMRDRLDAIRDGSFAREWETERDAGFPRFERLYEMARESDLIRDERRTMARLGLGEAGDGGDGGEDAEDGGGD